MTGISWEKLGLRVEASGIGLQYSHAMLPTPIHLGSVIRVYYSCCDTDLRGRIFYADLSPEPPYTAVHHGTRPVLDIGAGGDFDRDGVNPSQVVRIGDELLLYYIGWRRYSTEVPYTLIAGLALSRDEGQSFKKLGPLLPASEEEPYFRTAPFVYRNRNGWSVLYIGGGQFIGGSGEKRLPVYSLCQAHSLDGVTWPGRGDVLLAPSLADGTVGFGRPVLWHDVEGEPLIVLSRRTRSGYTLMQAPWPIVRPESVALRPILLPGPEDWDRDMTCFGAFCRSGRDELLFYNGNQFGRSGFGIASRPRRQTDRNSAAELDDPARLPF